ncbi:hypothetical protein EDO6_01536 [Paenibacillus xylanexedens]|nr:hypothetical protein EDO6_01536 [Paenibacillus xylanexedens]
MIQTAQFRLLVAVAYCCGNVFNGSYVDPKYTLVVHTIPPFTQNQLSMLLIH